MKRLLIFCLIEFPQDKHKDKQPLHRLKIKNETFLIYTIFFMI